MINLSDIARNSKTIDFKTKLRSLVYPEVFVAENMADYLDYSKNLKPPFFKQLPLVNICAGDVYAHIILYNVNLSKLQFGDLKGKTFLKVRDDTGNSIFLWSDAGFLPAQETFEEAKIKHNISDDDWVYKIITRFVYDEKISFISSIQKSPETSVVSENSFLENIVKQFSLEIPTFANGYVMKP